MWADGAGAVGAVVTPADCEFDMAVKKLTMKQLRDRTDRICSLIARNTYTTCATCGKKLAYKDRQWGHAFPRACLVMRWESFHECQCFTGDAELLNIKFQPIRQDGVKRGDLILGVNTDTMMPMIVEVLGIQSVEADIVKLPNGSECSSAHLCMGNDGKWHTAEEIALDGTYDIMNIWNKQ